MLKKGDKLERALAILDGTPSVDICKIGVLYVAQGQKTESEIFSNECGSPRYHSFLHRLGEILSLSHSTLLGLYTGGLDDSNENDGEFTLMYRDHLIHMLFHVATLMRNSSQDKNFTNKKRHM